MVPQIRVRNPIPATPTATVWGRPMTKRVVPVWMPRLTTHRATAIQPRGERPAAEDEGGDGEAGRWGRSPTRRAPPATEGVARAGKYASSATVVISS